MKNRRRNLTESVVSGGQLDREKGVVTGVKILGLESCHGYAYSPAALKQAVGLYEGKAVNVDHPEDRSSRGLAKSRSYRDRFGRLRNVEFREGEGLFGTLHYNRGHALAEQFEWDVDNDPKNLGLSQNARGEMNGRGDLVEAITTVRSVDLVADPATNVGLFEDRGGSRMALKVKKGKTAKRLLAEFLESVASDDEIADLLEAAEAAEEEAGPRAETPLEAVAKMAAAVVMDEGMDMAMKRKKLTKLLDLIDDSVADEGDESGEGEGEGGEEEVPEDAGERSSGGKSGGSASKLEARLAELEAKDAIRSLCEDAGFAATPAQLKLLGRFDPKTEKKDIEELIESWAGGSSESDATLGPNAKKPKSKSGTELTEDKAPTKEECLALLN